MQNLFEVLSQEDKDKITARMMYCGGDCGDALNCVDLKGALKSWNQNKPNLYKLLDENLIIEQEISVRKSPDMISDDIWEKLLSWDSSYEFKYIFTSIKDGFKWGEYSYFSQFPSTAPLKQILERLKDVENYELGENLQDLFCSSSLAKNIYEGDSFEIPAINPNEKSLKINKGCKAIKAISKIVDFWNLDKEAFEEFRLAHSLCLNQKNLTGTLCLSIHPLDYITMSDNTYGWSSCMSWEDSGDYRQGTLEMMGSEYVVVAYLKGEDKMYLNYSPSEEDAVKWNSKKWRQLFVVSPEMLLGIKSYPYSSEALTTTILGILREKAIKNLGWNFDDTLSKVNNRSNNVFANTKAGTVYVDLSMNHMYNDIGSGHFAYVSRAIPDHFELYLSGTAHCLTCGEYLDSEPESSLLCFKHNNGYVCDCCGQHMQEPYYMNDGDTILCENCYYDETSTCRLCDSREWNDNFTSIYLKIDNMKSEICTEVCECCLDDKKRLEEIFGPLQYITEVEGVTPWRYYPFTYLCADLSTTPESTLKEYFGVCLPEDVSKIWFDPKSGAIELDLSSAENFN